MTIEFTETGVSLTVAACKALLAFSSKDGRRGHLSSVGLTRCLSDVDGTEYSAIAATDGFSLVTFPVSGAPFGGTSVFWTREHAETECRCASIRKQNVKLTYSELVVHGTHSSFPPIAMVEPRPKIGATERIGLSPRFLARLDLVAKACKADCAVMVSSGDKYDPIRFDVRGDKLTARVTIMPMRLNHNWEE